MSGALTERQKEEMHKSMLDYFKTAGFTETYEALKRDAGLEDFTVDPSAKYAGLLSRKWTSVVRLQKKVNDSEQRINQLEAELSAAPTSRRSASQTDWLPRAPPRHTLNGHRKPVMSVAFHPLYNLLASASEDFTIKVWDWEDGSLDKTLKGHTKAVMDLDFDSQGKHLVSCASDLSVKVWDTINDWKNTKTFYGHDHTVSAVQFMPDDDFIISASRDKTIRIWQLSTGHCARTLSGHGDWVRSVTPSLDGRLLASCSSDQTARIWDYSNGEIKQDLRGHEHVVEAVVFAPLAAYPALRELAGMPSNPKEEKSAHGLFVATGSRDKTVKIWDTVNGQCVKTLSGHDNWVRSIVFAPSGKFLLTASDDKTIRIWDLKTGRCTKTIDAHSHFVTCIAWGRVKTEGAAQDGATVNGVNGSNGAQADQKVVNVIATCSCDQTINIWTP